MIERLSTLAHSNEFGYMGSDMYEQQQTLINNNNNFNNNYPQLLSSNPVYNNYFCDSNLYNRIDNNIFNSMKPCIQEVSIY